jgi:hypothetical protein
MPNEEIACIFLEKIRKNKNTRSRNPAEEKNDV